MSIIIYKLKKKLSDTNLSELLMEGIPIVLAFVMFSGFATIIYGLLLILIFGMMETTISEAMFNITSISLGMATVGVLMYIKLHVTNEHEIKNKNELTKTDTQDNIERDVEKTIRMEVVSKKEVVTQHGEIVRELLLRDPTGRVITYGKSYSQKNLNTIYFTVEQGKFYDFEWSLDVYDPTGKKNDYYKIVKIESKDVDLNN